MKKTLIVLLTALMVVSLFISCGNDPFFHTVEFDSNGGTEVERQVVRNGEKATAPKNPTKDGTEFVDWYDGENVFDFDTAITKDYKLTAKWADGSGTNPGGSATTYTVTFKLGEGTGSGFDAQTVAEGGNAVKPVTNPKPNDVYKSFVYWTADGKNEFKFAETAITADTELTAVYRDSIVGDTGPAGGYIFYVNPDYVEGSSDTTRNWKYLEAAPSDLTITNADGTTSSKIIFGYNMMNNGTSYVSQICTTENTSDGATGENAAIGQGEYNTTKLAEKMSTAAVKNADKPMDTTSDYAARLCREYGKDMDYKDWFLPSLEELKLMYTNLYKKGIGSFTGRGDGETYYWSSSEYDSGSAWGLDFFNGVAKSHFRYESLRVRPCRAY